MNRGDVSNMTAVIRLFRIRRGQAPFKRRGSPASLAQTLRTTNVVTALPCCFGDRLSVLPARSPIFIAVLLGKAFSTARDSVSVAFGTRNSYSNFSRWRSRRWSLGFPGGASLMILVRVWQAARRWAYRGLRVFAQPPVLFLAGFQFEDSVELARITSLAENGGATTALRCGEGLIDCKRLETSWRGLVIDCRMACFLVWKVGRTNLLSRFCVGQYDTAAGSCNFSCSRYCEGGRAVGEDVSPARVDELNAVPAASIGNADRWCFR